VLLTLHQSVFSRCDAVVGPLAPGGDRLDQSRASPQSLATAAAVIFKPPQTTGARLLPPVSAPEGTEGGLTVSRMPLRSVPAAFGDTRPPTQLP